MSSTASLQQKKLRLVPEMLVGFFPCQLALVEPSYSRHGVNALLKRLRRSGIAWESLGSKPNEACTVFKTLSQIDNPINDRLRQDTVCYTFCSWTLQAQILQRTSACARWQQVSCLGVLSKYALIRSCAHKHCSATHSELAVVVQETQRLISEPGELLAVS